MKQWQRSRMECPLEEQLEIVTYTDGLCGWVGTEHKIMYDLHGRFRTGREFIGGPHGHYRADIEFINSFRSCDKASKSSQVTSLVNSGHSKGSETTLLIPLFHQGSSSAGSEPEPSSNRFFVFRHPEHQLRIRKVVCK